MPTSERGRRALWPIRALLVYGGRRAGGSTISDPRRVHESIAAIAARVGGTVGVAARNLASGAETQVNADDLFPLASCFKIPVMVEVLRQVDAGRVRLDDRLTLTEADKSPGGTLIHCHAGLRPSVRDLLYLMITLSDNTATDMLWRLVGLDAVNETMRGLGLETFDCCMPNREYYLVECGAGEQWAGLSGPQVVARWRELVARGEHVQAHRRVLEDNARLSGAEFLHLYERRWGRDESLGYDDAFAVDQTLDNMGSPRDMAALLAMIAQNRCAAAPSCRLMIEVLAHQEWRGKIPAGLPEGLLVANKTGGVSGTSNDAAIVYTAAGAPLVLVVFWKGLGRKACAGADAAIAEIAGVLYEHLGDPA